jgi:hypothetical protein
MQWSPRVNLTPCDQAGSNGASGYQLNLTGRATSVPFTTDKVGSPRTTTDNTTAASPARLPSFAGNGPARSGFGSKGSTLPTWLSNYRKLRKSEHTDERSPRT